MKTKYFSKKGFTLVELLIVVLIIAISSAFAFPKFEKTIENREAKKAIDTMRTISQALRLYELNHGDLLDDGGNPIALPNLEAAGYLNSKEFAPKFDYGINAAINPPIVTALNSSTRRYLKLEQHPMLKGQDGQITDTAAMGSQQDLGKR